MKMGTPKPKSKSPKLKIGNSDKLSVNGSENKIRSLTDKDFQASAEAKKLARLYRKALGVE